jgi:uncharacterized coiled-coil protein SlyX
MFNSSNLINLNNSTSPNNENNHFYNKYNKYDNKLADIQRIKNKIRDLKSKMDFIMIPYKPFTNIYDVLKLPVDIKYQVYDLEIEIKTQEKKIEEINRSSESVLEDLSKFVQKWDPNDSLYNKYNKYENKLADIQRSKNKIRDLKLEIDIIMNPYKPFTNIYDVLNQPKAIDIKYQVYDLEIEIKAQEKKIEEINRSSESVLEDWSNYLDSAKDFIHKNNLFGIVKIKDIISTNNLYILFKQNIDGYIVSVNRPEYLQNAIILNKHFNIKSTKQHYNPNMFESDEFNKKREEIMKSMHANTFGPDEFNKKREEILKCMYIKRCCY